MIRTRKIVRYMDKAIKTKFRSKYFDNEDIAANVNLSVSDVKKIMY